MSATLKLGARLAIGTRGQRARALVTLIASALGTAVVLAVWGVADALLAGNIAFTPHQVNLLIAGTIAVVALPVVVLVSTIARLSAGVRDRRLANLRLLGMSAGQTRLVAATEAGLAAIAGALVGALFALAAVPLIGLLIPGPLPLPPAWAWPAVLGGVPLASVATATLPQRLAGGSALSQARRAPRRRLRVWRIVPLIVGFLLCWGTRSPLIDPNPHAISAPEMIAMLVGILLLGIGTLLVVPIFVDLVASAVMRIGHGPLARIVGRRLEAQPAGATRVISALMIGLFVVVAGQAVVTAFMTTPQHESAAHWVEQDQVAEVLAPADQVGALRAALERIDGVERIDTFTMLQGGPVDDKTGGIAVIVATCAELAGPSGNLAGCSDDAPSQLGDFAFYATNVDEMQLWAVQDWQPHDKPVKVSLEGMTSIDPADWNRSTGVMEFTALVILPPDTPGIAALLRETDRMFGVHAGPGRFLYDELEALGMQSSTMVDLENYDFVQGMQTVAWTVAAVVLGIGLLTFTVAGVDRALSRRRELTALRLIGTPTELLRWAQWFEAALPTALGSVFAILTGTYAGATYLQLDNDRLMPLASGLALAAIAVVLSAALAAITVIGTGAPLDPEHIRAE